jgi:hypothetical protein
MATFALAMASGVGCGGNVVVDGTAASTQSGAGAGTTMAGCKTTCLEALKQGGGICGSPQSVTAFTDIAGCANLNCPTQCADIGTAGADANCFSCLSGACGPEIMSCTGS